MAVAAGAPLGSPRAATAAPRRAQAMGTSFNDLLATAKIESDLDPSLTILVPFPGGGRCRQAHRSSRSNPQLSAASVFPVAAAANRPIFYDRAVNARSVSGVYSELVRRFGDASDGWARWSRARLRQPRQGQLRA